MRPSFPLFGPIPRSRSAAPHPRAARLVGRLIVSVCVMTVSLILGPATLVQGQDNAAQATAPSGIYTVTISTDDVPPGLAGGPALIGQWTLTFNKDGTYVVARQDVGAIATGHFAINGATLTFDGWAGIIACGGEDPASGGASYGWQIDGDQLQLTPVQDTCAERQILLSTRAFGGYEPCTVAPLALMGEAAPPEATPVANPPIAPALAAATPTLAQDEGVASGADVGAAIDTLLRQASGCWATQDPTRFLALHSQQVLTDLTTPVPGGETPDQVLSDLQMFMATPVTFERIGKVTMIDPTHAWAYVEITFGGEPVPQRFNFALEDGAWLLDTFFLFGPPSPTPAAP